MEAILIALIALISQLPAGTMLEWQGKAVKSETLVEIFNTHIIMTEEENVDVGAPVDGEVEEVEEDEDKKPKYGVEANV